MGVLTAPRSPWQDAFCERVVGTVRRECLDHVIVLREQHLRRILRKYLQYYHSSRTTSRSTRTPRSCASASPATRGRSSPSLWSADCITTTPDARPERGCESQSERRAFA